jgi:hypothetical protein
MKTEKAGVEEVKEGLEMPGSMTGRSDMDTSAPLSDGIFRNRLFPQESYSFILELALL